MAYFLIPGIHLWRVLKQYFIKQSQNCLTKVFFSTKTYLSNPAQRNPIALTRREAQLAKAIRWKNKGFNVLLYIVLYCYIGCTKAFWNLTTFDKVSSLFLFSKKRREMFWKVCCMVCWRMVVKFSVMNSLNKAMK